MKVLRDESMMVRDNAAAALAQISDSAQAAAPALTAALNDEHLYVRGNAADALKRIRI